MKFTVITFGIDFTNIFIIGESGIKEYDKWVRWKCCVTGDPDIPNLDQCGAQRGSARGHECGAKSRSKGIELRERSRAEHALRRQAQAKSEKAVLHTKVRARNLK